MVHSFIQLEEVGHDIILRFTAEVNTNCPNLKKYTKKEKRRLNMNKTFLSDTRYLHHVH